MTGQNGNLGLANASNIFGLFTTHSFTHSTIVGTYPMSLNSKTIQLKVETDVKFIQAFTTTKKALTSKRKVLLWYYLMQKIVISNKKS